MGNKNSKKSKKQESVDTSTTKQDDDVDLDPFSETVLQSTCDQLSNCLAVQRLSTILLEFHRFKNNPDSCNFKSMSEYIEGLGNTYNNSALLNDYIHLLNEHNSNEDFEYVYKCFISEMTDICDVMTCNFFSRYRRDRSRDYEANVRDELYNTSETKEITTQQIIDKIHCYWLHTFDLAYKLTSEEIEQMSNNADTDTKNDDEIDESILKKYVDNELLYRQQIIKSKRERFKATENKRLSVCENDTNRHAKWRLTKDEKSHKIKLDNEGAEIYSFGFPYKYSKYHKKNEWFIPTKYDTFKIEMINCMDAIIFRDWYEKGQDYFESSYCKTMSKWMGESITIEHLLSVMIYCGMDKLQRSLTETYRKVDENESDQDLIKRHSEFANWGSLLSDTVNNFGKEVSKHPIKTFYHGIDHEMRFASTIAFFYCPLSTSSAFQVAQVFATRSNNIGLIIELEHLDGSRACYFDCGWLSEYPYESEKLFIGGDFGLLIKNIVEPSSGENYKIFIEGLNIIQQMWRGEMYKYDKKLPKYLRKCVVKLLNHQLYKQTKNEDKYEKFAEIPDYIEQLLQCYCLNVLKLSIDWRALHGISNTDKKKGYEYAKDIFVIDDFNQSFIDLNVISLLFPNAYRLVVADIRLCRQTAEAMLNYCCQAHLNENNKLTEILIYRPLRVYSFEDDPHEEIEKKIDKDKEEIGVIDIAIQEYDDQFRKSGWKLAKKSKFELLVLNFEQIDFTDDEQPH